MPPATHVHVYLGLTLGEWVAMLTIISFVLTGIMFLLRAIIIRPLGEQIKHSNDLLSNNIHMLSEKIAQLDTNSREIQRDHEKRISKNERQLTAHGEDIKTLFKETGAHIDRGNR